MMQGTMVGLRTRKCIDYAPNNTCCRKCVKAGKIVDNSNLTAAAFIKPDQQKQWRHPQQSNKARKKYKVLIREDDSTAIPREQTGVDVNLEKNLLCMFFH